MPFNIFDLHNITKDTTGCLHFLRQHHLLATSQQCCGQPMSEDQYPGIDGVIWRCHSCWKRLSVRHDSFFDNSKIALQTLIFIIYFFCTETTLKEALMHLKGRISLKHLCYWFNYCRDVITRHMLNHFPPLGGVGKVVEADETLVGHIRKYYVGNNRNQTGIDIFGMIERITLRCFMAIIDDRSRNSVIPHIQRLVAPGTTIITDEAKIYEIIPRMGMNFTHKTVCHATNFVNPRDASAHTNTIEGLWSHLKVKWRAMRGVKKSNKAAHIDEMIWRWNNKGSDCLFTQWLHDARLQYNF